LEDCEMKKFTCIIMILLLSATLGFARGGGTAREEAEYKIGICFDIGGRGDRSFNDSAYNGLVMVAEEFGGYIKDDPDGVDFGDRVEMKYLEPKAGGQDRELLMRALAEEGYNLIFGVGFLWTDSLAKVAAEFPDIHFGLIDGWLPDLGPDSNITCLSFAEHEGSFLMGAVAGLMAGDEKVGFLGGMDIPLIHKFQAGFLAGAMFVNPNLRDEAMLLGQYVGKDPSAFADPKAGESISTTLYRQGAAIIYHAAGLSGTGLFKAAKDAGKPAIGVDSDQGLIYATSDNAEEREIAEYIVTSMLKRVDISVFQTSRIFIEEGGNVPGGYHEFNLADEGVGIAVNEFNEARLAPFLGQIEELKEMIITGKIVVPGHDSEVREWALETFK
jgi:basic membrane protein A